MKMVLLLRFLVVALTMLFALPNRAVDFSTNAAAGVAPLIQGRVKINQVTVFNSTTNTILVHLFDMPVNSSTTTYSYSSYIVTNNATPSSIVTTYTNVFGTVENWTNTATTLTATTIAAATNSYPKLVQFSIAGSGSATWTPSSPTYSALGLVASNGAAATININYSR